MSDPAAPRGFTALVGAVTKLTPEFMALLLVNVVFICGMLWLFDKQNSARERVLTPILERCAESVPLEVLKYLPPAPSNH